MVRKKTKKHTELTEAEKEMLQETIITDQNVKMMSCFMKWGTLFIFLLILDFARLMDAIDNIFAHLKQWFSKN
ncbi:hypothetical protein HNQ69_000574 [Bartonella callosciuri]|uniref:Uncharacterized protein n=1 Tax=Bartonella callosciuri TaxID=686223 RepID=A0A840NU35_9HYPH|nr:hypothetical protein [Bartonella callosciuri]MBB5073453.1 hypothetical protein [Bartonella callosciuri]